MSKNDIKNEFYATIREKKTANFHFKPKPLRFGHENLTRKELKALNGETKTYTFTSCHTIQEFKKYPKDIQIEFLKFLKKRYENRMSYMAAFLNTSRPTLRSLLKSYGLYEEVESIRLPHDKTIELRARLKQDMGDTPTGTDVNIKEIDAKPKKQPKENKQEKQAKESKQPVLHAKEATAMLNLTYSGFIKGEELKTKLEAIASVIATGEYNVDITITQKG